MQSNSWVDLRGQIAMGVRRRAEPLDFFFEINLFLTLFVRAHDEFCLCLNLENIREYLMSVDGRLLMMAMLI